MSARSLLLSALSLYACISIAGTISAQGQAIKGSFTGNGTPAKLAYISASKGEPFSGKPTIQIIMTEKDHSKARNPSIKAGFGDFGSALIITVHPDGKIIGCEVAHEAHPRKPFSSIGKIKTADFKMADGMITSKLSTEGEQDFFKQKWEVNLSFQVKAP